MSEEMDETEAEMDIEFEPRDVYNFLDCIFVIEILTLHSLKWTRKLGTVSTAGLLATQKNLAAISAQVRQLKKRIRRQTREVMGGPQLQKDTYRHTRLWRVILRVLKEMQVF